MAYFRDETNAFAEAERLRNFIDTYEADEATAQAVADHHNAWPQAAPGTKLALAKGKVPTDSPLAKEAARLSTKKKAKKSGFFQPFRTGIGALGNALEDVGDVATTGLKGVVRGAATVASAPFEEAAGLLRTAAGSIGGRPGGAVAGAAGGAALGAGLGLVGGPLAPVTSTAGAIFGGVIGGVAGLLGGDDIKGQGGIRSQSSLGQAIGQLVKTGEADLGAGYMPSGTAHVQAAAAARKTASIAGRGLTLGRLTANAVVEPGTTPYNVLSGLVDFGAAIKLDPAAIAGAKLAKVNAARKTILSEKAGTELLATAEGARLKEALAGNLSPFDIWHRSNGQIPVDIAVQLANETDVQKTGQILDGVLGTDVRSKFKPNVASRRVPRIRAKMGFEPGTSRLTSNLPVGELDWNDPADFIGKIDGLQANARVPKEVRLANNDKMMKALAGPRAGRIEPFRQITASIIESSGLDGDTAKIISNMVPKSLSEARMYTASEIATNQRIPGLVIGDAGQELVAPQLLSEFLDAKIPVPTMQELRVIRQETGKLTPMFAIPKVGEAIRTSDIMATALMNRVWKAGVLLRVAIVPRVTGEEQIRMASAGYDSMFNHPMSYISRLIGKKGDVAVTGDKLSDSIEAGKALSSRNSAAGFMDQGPLKSFISTGHRAKFRPEEEADFLRGWRDHELGHLRADAIAGHAAKNGGEATKEWLRTGKGQKFLQELWAHKPDDPNFMRSQADIGEYVDTIVMKRIQDFTQGDQRLLKYISDGPKAGPLEDVAKKDVTNVLKEMFDGGARPEAVVGDISVGVRAGAGAALDGTTSYLFSLLMQRPTNFLNRSKTFQQAYWKRAEELVGDLNQADQVKLLTNAKKAKLGNQTITRIQKIVDDPTKVGGLKLDNVDFLSKGFGLEETQSLLYDLSKKGLSSDALRLVMPFAEPWREMMTTWLGPNGLLVNNPQALRRMQQTVEGARGSGFFTTDDQTGEEMFTYPGSEFISKVFTGAPIPLKGRVAGLNLFAQNPLMPGFGPLVQVPAAAIISEKPEYDWIRDAINPMGRSDESTIEQFVAPAAWVDKVKKVFADPESDRVFANTVYDMSRYLVSTGEYEIDSLEGQERTSKTAVTMARKMYMLRALGSFTAPSAPSPEFKSALKDTSGRLLTQFQLIDDFRKMQEDPEIGYENAVGEFLNKYGEDALLYMQPKTRGGGPATDDMQEWVRSNPELTSRYPDVYQFFGPRTGEFSYTAYERQLATGEREQITPDEAYKLGNNRVAMMAWRKAKEKVGVRPNANQKAWLNTIHQTLLDQYPGFEDQPMDLKKNARSVRHLQDALEDPKLAGTNVGQDLEVYFAARDKAQEAATAAGLAGFGKAKAMRGVRDWLRNIGNMLVDDNPDFAAVWEQVLDREMADDPPEISGEGELD